MGTEEIKNNGGPAFPVVKVYNNGDTSQLSNGMSLRDYFAAKAMQGISANNKCNEMTFEDIAKLSYKQADAMLQSREK